jgi:hypothetical protein
LVVVPPPVATTSPTVVVGAKGVARDPWAAFCASGEILSAAAAKDVAGSMSQRLREASQQLPLQLKRVSCVGLRCLLFLWGFRSHGFVLDGRLRRPRRVGCLDCGRGCRGREPLGAACGCCPGEVGCGKQKPQAGGESGHHGGREDGPPAPLAEEMREANPAIADVQAARAEAKVARAESSLASQRAEELEARFNALRSSVDKVEASMCSEVERMHAQFVDTYRELGARTADFEVSSQEAGLRFLEWLQEELQVLPTIVTGFMSFASLVTCEGAVNALSHEGCRHYEVFDQADENFEREIFKVKDPVVKQSAGALFDRMWGPHDREAVRERSDRAIKQVKAVFVWLYVWVCVVLLNECVVAADGACQRRRGPWWSGRRAARGHGGQSGAALGCR